MKRRDLAIGQVIGCRCSSTDEDCQIKGVIIGFDRHRCAIIMKRHSSSRWTPERIKLRNAFRMPEKEGRWWVEYCAWRLTNGNT